MDRIRCELDNVRAALGWAVEHGRTGAGLRLAGALRSFWVDGGHRQEGMALLERFLAGNGAVDPDVRARGLQAAGFLAANVAYGLAREDIAPAFRAELKQLLGN